MLSLKSILLAALPAVHAISGIGQLRTLYIGRDHDDLGCLTSAGKWTTNESQCGVFYAYQLSRSAQGVSTFRLGSIDVGLCGIVPGGGFKCGSKDVQGADFATWGPDGPVKQREVLRYGQYGVVASSGNNPPALTDGALDVHFYTGAEKGKYVWLVWKPLEDIQTDEA